MSLSFADAAKAKQLREYFAEHGRIYIVVDATSDDVDLPDFLKGDPALRLVLNARMPQIIHIRDDSLVSDFSFSGSTYPCVVPMHTIWAAYLPEGDLEQGVIWDDSVPEMIRAIVKAVRSNMADSEDQTGDKTEDQEAPATNAQETAEETTEDTSVASTITVINGGGSEKETASDDDEKPKKRKTDHLRVVK